MVSIQPGKPNRSNSPSIGLSSGLRIFYSLDLPSSIEGFGENNLSFLFMWWRIPQPLLVVLAFGLKRLDTLM